jgi:secondary thiamine-phosphate synthase enzyme
MVELFEIKVKTKNREEIVDITSEVEEILKKSKIQEGICFLYIPHTTASLIINENADENIKKDILNWLRENIKRGIWLHDSIDNNGDSHIKSTFLGCSQIIPIKDNKLLLGRWQGIMLAEFDGPRERKVYVILQK